tara:strand:+ start:137 stop:436 length:300 start_codon:yes stop_codon:yes gene_type:complete
MTDIKELLVDMRHYLWLSSLRNCWKDTEKNDVNKLYNRIVSMIEMEKQNNSEIHITKEQLEMLAIDKLNSDIHDRDYIKTENELNRYRKDSDTYSLILE